MELKAEDYTWPDGHVVRITVVVIPGEGLCIKHRHCSSGWATDWSSILLEKCRLVVKADDRRDGRWESIDSICLVTTEDPQILQKTKLTISSPVYGDDITVQGDIQELLIACRKAIINN